jgi:NAD(P)-dependent dehydrogenase (short-subunit alcohol dehydrogenase family)
MTTLTGKVALVTGATSGIGKATALGLAKLGATIVMVIRDRGKGEAARNEIIAATSNQAVDLMTADLASQHAIRQLAADFKARYSKLHVLVNNARGIYGERKLTADGLEYTFALNNLAYFLLTNLLLDTLKASAPSRIVNLASGAHQMGTINFDDL